MMKSHILISKINEPILIWRITITDFMGYTRRDGKPLLAERTNFNEKVNVEYRIYIKLHEKMSLLDINDVENQLNEQLLEDAIKEYFTKKYPEYPYVAFKNIRGSFKNNEDDDVFVCNFVRHFNIVYVSLTSIDVLNTDMILGITNKSAFGDYVYVDVGGGIKKILTFKLFKQIYGFTI